MTGPSLINIGSESEKGVVSAFDDLFGPSFRTIGEYLADKVRYHRLRSLQKIIRKAKDFGPDGIRFLTPPPMKFMLPFIEGASLEDESDEDETLCTLWAKLLSEACQEYDVKQLHYVKILNDISGREARLLHALATRYRGNHSAPMIFPGDFDAGRQFLTAHYAKEFLDNNIHRISNDNISAEFIEQFENPGSHITHILVSDRSEDGSHFEARYDELSGRVSPLVKEFGELTFDLLRRVSLLEEVRIDMVKSGDVGIEFDAYVMTLLGGDFYQNCASAAFTNGDLE